MAADKGLKVIDTASGSESDRMRGLGAATTIDHTQADVIQQVKHLFPSGVDALIDLVSDSSKLAALTDIVRQGGYVFSTIGSANDQTLRAKGLLGGNFVLKPIPQLLDKLADAVAAGTLEVPIEATITLDQVPDAMARSRAGHSHGKTVIRVSSPDTE
jgi:NADPH:quinone reductase-like Zn-dependent oxidoreductase